MTANTSKPAGTTFERFVASSQGRVARLALGAGLVAAGLGIVRGSAGLGISTLGLVPIATGVFNLCPIAPVWGGHFLGSRYCSPKDDVAPR